MAEMTNTYPAQVVSGLLAIDNDARLELVIQIITKREIEAAFFELQQNHATTTQAAMEAMCRAMAQKHAVIKIHEPADHKKRVRLLGLIQKRINNLHLCD